MSNWVKFRATASPAANQVHPKFVRCSLSAITLLAAMLITGCGSKVSQSNFDKIDTGMSQEQVETILGAGKEQGSSAVNVPGNSVGGMSVPGLSTSVKILSWQDGTKVISITFQDGKVMAKAQSGL